MQRSWDGFPPAFERLIFRQLSVPTWRTAANIPGDVAVQRSGAQGSCMDSIASILVFTDLDGTLIEHETYSFQPAVPALTKLRDIGAGVVLASSKTAPEIIALRHELGLEAWPAIVENGAGLLPAYTRSVPPGNAYIALRVALTRLPSELRQLFRGFGDMSAAEVCEVTGLPEDQAELARQRAYSEPGLWLGTKDERSLFLEKLTEIGVFAREGGRFLTLSFGATKADQMAQITQQFQPLTTVALGDAPNDVEMLETANHGIIVANPHRPALPVLRGETCGRITRTDLAGPHGWNAAMLRLIERLN